MAPEVALQDSQLPLVFKDIVENDALAIPKVVPPKDVLSEDQSTMKDSKTEQDAHETLVGAENGPARAEEAPLTLEDLDGIKKGLEDIEAIKEITDGGFSLCGLKGCECGLNADALLLGKVRSHRGSYLTLLEEVYRRYTTKHMEDDNVKHSSEAESGDDTKTTNDIFRFIDYLDTGDDLIESLPEAEKPKTEADKNSAGSRKGNRSAIVLNNSVRKRLDLQTSKYTYTPVRSKPLKMRIYSLELIKALKNVSDIHSCGEYSEDVLTTYEPFGHITRNLRPLSEEVARSGNGDLKAQFELLRGIIYHCHPKLTAELELHSQPPHRCTYEMLWLLYEKDQDVILTDRFGYRAAVVSDVRIELDEDGRPSLVLQTWSMNFDGKDFGKCMSTTPLPVFDGTREISSLPICPMQYHIHDGGEERLRKDLIARGKKFWNLRKPVQRIYTGQTIASVRKYIDQKKVMVDFQTYCRLHEDAIVFGDLGDDLDSGLICTDCLDKKVAKRKATGVSTTKSSADTTLLTDRQYMLLTDQVPVFLLQDREWIVVGIDGLEDYEPSDEGFRRLVLPDGHAEIIEALIKTRKATGIKKIEARHSRALGKPIDDAESMGAGFHADLVRGKGNGLIILLHGAPGVGKTSSAECVAEMTNLPLYPITCGDIGTKPDVVEKSLKQHFELAQLWNAVVLLDEADVFLQSRNVDHSSLQRNALVSVFLRVLEYYEGILILTTNRIGDFDEAFTSRIHIMLHYPTLENDAIGKIWKGMKDNLEEVRPDITVSGQVEEYILHSKHIRNTCWNGRQIRNAFQTAITLAEYEATKNKKKIVVKQSHFEKVVKLSTEFDAYLKRTWKASADALAADGNIRAAEKAPTKSRRRRQNTGSGGEEDD